MTKIKKNARIRKNCLKGFIGIGVEIYNPDCDEWNLSAFFQSKDENPEHLRDMQGLQDQIQYIKNCGFKFV